MLLEIIRGNFLTANIWAVYLKRLTLQQMLIQVFIKELLAASTNHAGLSEHFSRHSRQRFDFEGCFPAVGALLRSALDLCSALATINLIALRVLAKDRVERRTLANEAGKHGSVGVIGALAHELDTAIQISQMLGDLAGLAFFVIR
jgi:hypothetical protein